MPDFALTSQDEKQILLLLRKLGETKVTKEILLVV